MVLMNEKILYANLNLHLHPVHDEILLALELYNSVENNHDIASTSVSDPDEQFFAKTFLLNINYISTLLIFYKF
jgi:hypothetical protein